MAAGPLSTGAKIHHNYVHHNQRLQRGYGVVVQGGNSTATIWCNAFNANRHAIAGSGEAGEGYTAYQNVVMGVGNGHSFDMHDGPNGIGGKYVSITDNWFLFGPSPFYASIKVLGVPTDGIARITGNYFRADQVDGSSMDVVRESGAVNCALRVSGVTVARGVCQVL